MKISTEKLTWSAQTNTFVGEASDLGLSAMPKSVEIWNPKTGSSTDMNFDKYDTNGDEVAGARYTSHQGYKLLIIND